VNNFRHNFFDENVVPEAPKIFLALSGGYAMTYSFKSEKKRDIKNV
jgi:hypothetical protein